MSGGVAVPIPEADRLRVRELVRHVQRGRAAEMQLNGIIQGIAVDAGIDPSAPARVVEDDVIFMKKDSLNETLQLPDDLVRSLPSRDGAATTN